MLELRPNCEACDRDLAPSSEEAMICSYECTFCSDCVENLLSNVCPNCGGGFTSRPIRPNTERRFGISLLHQPASLRRVNTKYNFDEMKGFSNSYKHIKPERR